MYYIVCSYDRQNNSNITFWGYTRSPDHYTRGEQWVLDIEKWRSNIGYDFCFKTYGYEVTNAFLLKFGFIAAEAMITEVSPVPYNIYDMDLV